MVFFKDAIEHVTRAARVFRQPGGHMILVRIFITFIIIKVKEKVETTTCKVLSLEYYKVGSESIQGCPI